MKGGYNQNGTNSSAASVLGLTTALSQLGKGGSKGVKGGSAVANSTVTNDSYNFSQQTRH